MTGEVVLDVFLDALKDSAIVLAFVFAFHVLLSFIEDKLSNFLTKHRKTGPLFGSIFGIIPQCGTSVIAGDLYISKYITMGTVVAIFLSCSDEALIVLLNPVHFSSKTIMVLPLIGLKFLIGFLVGFLVDLIYKKQEIVDISKELEDVSCSDHHHHGNVKLHKHLIHPLIHSLEIFAFVLVINFSLGLIIASVGEDAFISFMTSNRYLTPLFATFIGLIPNCVSSVLISELYLSNSIPFGALLAGLLMNAGLGMMVLLKNKNTIKKTFVILGICFITSIVVGYISSLFEWFI